MNIPRDTTALKFLVLARACLLQGRSRRNPIEFGRKLSMVPFSAPPYSPSILGILFYENLIHDFCDLLRDSR